MGRPRTLSDEERRLRKNERQKKYRADPKNKTQEKRAKYRSIPDVKTKEKVRVSSYNRLYGLKNREQINRNRKINTVKKRAGINVRHNTSRNELESKRKNQLFKILGGYICAQCKFKDHRALEIEHIHDTGNLDKKRFTDTRQERAYYIKNPMEAIKNLQIFCSNCNEIKEYENKNKKWNEKTHDIRNVRNRENYHNLKNFAFEVLGGHICVICKKFKDHRALNIDHIQGGGRLDRNKRSRQDQLFRYIIKNPNEVKKKLQIVCKNCNQIKKEIMANGKCNCGLLHVNYS